MKIGPLSVYYCPGLLWVRIFGIGLMIKDSRRHPLLYSQRNGPRRMRRVGNIAVGFLPRITL